MSAQHSPLHEALLALPVFDNHCHLFQTSAVELDLARLLSMSLEDMPAGQLRQTMIYRVMLAELARLFGMPLDEGRLLAELATRRQDDYPGYVRMLLKDARLTGMAVDLGYKPAEVELDDFSDLTGIDTVWIWRMESAVDALWQDVLSGALDMAEAERRFLDAMDAAVESLGAVAVKSIIGYRTGLAVEHSPDTAPVASSSPAEKVFRDHCFVLGVRRAAERGLAVQVHAAFGESNIHTERNNPALLKHFLDRLAPANARIILVHGGYPYSFEAGYLGAVYPNVYVDLSEMIPFAPLGLMRGLEQIFDMCPFNKILYGSDGFVSPEIHWLGAVTGRRALAALFGEYMARGLFSLGESVEVLTGVLSGNARELYRL